MPGNYWPLQYAAEMAPNCLKTNHIRILQKSNWLSRCMNNCNRSSWQIFKFTIWWKKVNYSVAAPGLWNSLSEEVHITLALLTFRQIIKRILFLSAFSVLCLFAGLYCECISRCLFLFMSFKNNIVYNIVSLWSFNLVVGCPVALERARWDRTVFNKIIQIFNMQLFWLNFPFLIVHNNFLKFYF